MTPEEAREKLGFHAGSDERIHDPRWEGGFLPSLRYYDGKPNIEAMKEIVECVRTLKEPLQTETLPRELVDDLWSICFLGRLWAVEKDGMLRRNNLIREEDIALLDEWITEVSLAVLGIFDGSPESAEDSLIDAGTLTQTYQEKKP